MKDKDKEIEAKLETIVKLLALSVIQDKTMSEKINILSSAGFQPKKIAEMIGTTANTVRVTLSGIRKGSRGR